MLPFTAIYYLRATVLANTTTLVVFQCHVVNSMRTYLLQDGRGLRHDQWIVSTSWSASTYY